ncbi:hypothetical protein [Phytohabitans suffuscus]
MPRPVCEATGLRVLEPARCGPTVAGLAASGRRGIAVGRGVAVARWCGIRAVAVAEREGLTGLDGVEAAARAAVGTPWLRLTVAGSGWYGREAAGVTQAARSGNPTVPGSTGDVARAASHHVAGAAVAAAARHVTRVAVTSAAPSDIARVAATADVSPVTAPADVARVIATA